MAPRVVGLCVPDLALSRPLPVSVPPFMASFMEGIILDGYGPASRDHFVVLCDTWRHSGTRFVDLHGILESTLTDQEREMRDKQPQVFTAFLYPRVKDLINHIIDTIDRSDKECTRIVFCHPCYRILKHAGVKRIHYTCPTLQLAQACSMPPIDDIRFDLVRRKADRLHLFNSMDELLQIASRI
jgi:hypothetical protein